MSYYLPSAASRWLGQNIKEVDNFHLLLNRYLEFEEPQKPGEEGKFSKLATKGIHESFLFGKRGRRGEAEEDKIPFKALCRKAAAATSALHPNGNAAAFHYRTAERLILGAASVLENSLRLHHIWGFPFIPASSIKGLVRSYVIESLFADEGIEKAEERAMKEDGFRILFGSSGELSPTGKDSKGGVAFYDALPTHPPRLKLDIMNPHYQEYFSSAGKIPPADYLSPIPIFFLTIDKGNSFQFCLGALTDQSLPEDSPLARQSGHRQPLAAAAYFLDEALEENGIGGKTAVGYGFMEKTND